MTAPANDNFADAITLSGTSEDGTLDDSTIEAGEPTVGSYFNRSVWYKWVPTAGYGNSARFWIDQTLGYTYAIIYTGTAVDDLTPVNVMDIVAETEYYIQVIFHYDATYSPSANFTIYYSDPDVVQPSGPANDGYAGAIALDENETLAGNSYYAGYGDHEVDWYDDDGTPVVSPASYGVWYSFTPSISNAFNIFIVENAIGYRNITILDEDFNLVGPPSSSYVGTSDFLSGNTYYILVTTPIGIFPPWNDDGAFTLQNIVATRIYSSLVADASISADAYTVHNRTARSALNTEVTISAELVKKPSPRASLTINTTFISDGEDANTVLVNATARNIVNISVSSRAFTATTYIPAFKGVNQIRTMLSVKLTFPDPAIIDGKPYVPDYWSHLEGSYTATANNTGTILVVEDPEPEEFDSGDDKPGQSRYIWKASDLANTRKLTKWPVHSGSGPSWASARGYEPSVGSRITFGSKGKYHTQSKGVLFDYHNVEHMWLRLPTAKSDDFTWMICGIILSYPSARYGHYVLDHGWNTKKVKPLPRTEGTSKKLGDSGYRAAMLYQRNSALMGSHTGEDLAGNGKHVRIENNYLPKPRVMYSIWNNGASNNKGTIGTIGRGYHKSKTGTIDSETMRDFVIGRRFNKISTDLASHMVIFEIRYFPRALGKKEIRRQANNLASLYKFGKY